MAKPYQVIDVYSGKTYGPYETLALAQAYVKQSQIKDWEILDASGKCVDWRWPN